MNTNDKDETTFHSNIHILVWYECKQIFYSHKKADPSSLRNAEIKLSFKNAIHISTAGNWCWPIVKVKIVALYISRRFDMRLMVLYFIEAWCAWWAHMLESSWLGAPEFHFFPWKNYVQLSFFKMIGILLSGASSASSNTEVAEIQTGSVDTKNVSG